MKVKKVKKKLKKKNAPIIKYTSLNGWSFKKDHVNTWAWAKNVFSPEECQKIIDIGNSLNPTGGRIQGEKNIETTNDTIRKSLVSWVGPNQNTNWIFIRLQKIVEKLNNDFFKFHITGINEGFQFTKYRAPGGHYDKHFDKMWDGVIRKLSLTIQLTDPSKYEGGDLEIFQSHEPLKMEKEQGMAILFPSYVLHGVTPITKGERCSLVGWFTGDPFK
jgi:PKHD-type hydroxylase|tara:strand:+ start:176 stop:826 length:651 start_codon:yes stop_codon:yes gene_type:complete